MIKTILARIEAKTLEELAQWMIFIGIVTLLFSHPEILLFPR